MSDLRRDPRPRRDLLDSAAASQVAGLAVDLDDVLGRARRRRLRRCHARRVSAMVLVAAGFAAFLLVTVLGPEPVRPAVSREDRLPGPATVVWEPGIGTATTPVPRSDAP